MELSRRTIAEWDADTEACDMGDDPWGEIPVKLCGELPEGAPDVPRHWCTSCGLPDPPRWGEFDAPVPCPRCGSFWRWYGRLADRDGTASGPPDDGTCLGCFEWRRYPHGQEHFGWAWLRTCGRFRIGTSCAHTHHDGEIWLA